MYDGQKQLLTVLA